LREKVRLGEFREDLYYRLKVVEIELPPLRERREDVPLLVDHFFNLLKRRFDKGVAALSQDVLSAFMSYPWPGNVRELEHAMEHAFVLCRADTITCDDLPAEIREYPATKPLTVKRRRVGGQNDVLEALNRTDWNKAKAARLLGVSRQTLYRIIERYGLVKPAE
jgi:transcriptional regulator with PAS, ATPase and Fis domain